MRTKGRPKTRDQVENAGASVVSRAYCTRQQLYGWRHIQLVEPSKGISNMTTAPARTRTHAGGRTQVRPGDGRDDNAPGGSLYKRKPPSRGFKALRNSLLKRSSWRAVPWRA